MNKRIYLTEEIHVNYRDLDSFQGSYRYLIPQFIIVLEDIDLFTRTAAEPRYLRDIFMVNSKAYIEVLLTVVHPLE